MMIRQVRVISLLLVLCGLIACQEDDKIQRNDSLTGQLSYFGLQGPVSSLQEFQVMDENDTIWSSISFDPCGRITHFSPSPFSNGSLKENIIRPLVEFMPPGNDNTYTYFYNEKGVLSKIRQTNSDLAYRDFLLTYDESDVYVPLPLPLGMQPITLLKGLKTITSEENDFYPAYQYVFDGSKTLYQESGWNYQIQESYEFEANLPSCLTTLVSQEDSVIYKSVIFFTFSNKGALLKTEQSIFQNETETILFTSYNENGNLISRQKHYLNTLELFTQSYDINGNLLSAVKEEFDEKHQLLSESSFNKQLKALDTHQNWTLAEDTYNGYFDEFIDPGIYSVYRRITYHN